MMEADAASRPRCGQLPTGNAIPTGSLLDTNPCRGLSPCQGVLAGVDRISRSVPHFGRLSPHVPLVGLLLVEIGEMAPSTAVGGVLWGPTIVSARALVIGVTTGSDRSKRPFSVSCSLRRIDRYWLSSSNRESARRGSDGHGLSVPRSPASP